MNEIILLVVAVLFFGILFFGGKTYYMTPESFIKQLSIVTESNLKQHYDFRLGIIPALIRGEQFDNGIGLILCTDKKGDRYRIRVNRSTQIRITKIDKKRQQLYFDTIFIKNNLVYGNRTHFAKLPIKPIPLEQILKIEFQFRNSKKEYI
jgi:hypothetical protein